MTNYNKDNESSYIQYWDENNLYEWEKSQQLPANGFKWNAILLNLRKSSWKTIIKIAIKDIFLNILNIHMIYRVIYHFYQRE